MIEIAKESHSLTDYGDVSKESLLEYKQRKQIEFVHLLNGAKEKGNIDELSYKRLLLETCEFQDWDKTFEHFNKLWKEALHATTQMEFQKLSDRIIRGAQMIENESDPGKRKIMMDVYDALLKRMQEIST